MENFTERRAQIESLGLGVEGVVKHLCNKDVLEVKMDILIKDFQRYRESQEEVNRGITKHSLEENGVQARILTTLRWHTAIGTVMVSSIVGLAFKMISV